MYYCFTNVARIRQTELDFFERMFDTSTVSLRSLSVGFDIVVELCCTYMSDALLRTTYFHS